MSKALMREDGSSADKTKKVKLILWLKRLGFVGFMFFLLKGLIWLAIFFGLTRLSFF